MLYKFTHSRINGNTQKRSTRNRISAITPFLTHKNLMVSSMKFLCVLGLILLIGSVVDGAGECGRSSPDDEAMKLAPCVGAAEDANAAVPGGCCSQIKRFSQNPKCLCAILLSDTAKASGVRPEVALTIPKRCNFANRPVGYKCGAYTLP